MIKQLIKSMSKRVKNYQTRLSPLLMAAIAAIFVGIRVISGLLHPTAETKASDLTVESILAAVNNERSNRNLVTLTTNQLLGEAADFKAHDMITRKYFAHVDPDGHYIWPKIVSLGYAPYSMLGENLAIEFYSTESLMQAWMDSPTHRANVLQEGFRDQGMGLAFGNTQNGEYGTSIANTFGTLLPKKTPAPQTPKPAPTPTSVKPTPKPVAKSTPAPKPVTKPAPKKVATAPVKTTAAPPPPSQIKAAEEKPQETKVEKAVEEIRNLNPITPRGIADALYPLLPQAPKSTSEQNFQTGQGAQPPALPETPAPTPAYQETSTQSNNPYAQYRLWGIIVAIGSLGLLAVETKKYIKDKIHVPRHRWNTILMLILTLLVTALAYVI